MLVTQTSSPAFHTQCCVIGAGAIGLAVARALALAGKEVLLVDQAATIGSETSSRNSEVIHAGLYYPTNSWKATFCVQGKHGLYEYCRQRKIPVRNCGKLIVATHTDQLTNQVEQLRRQALANGVEDVRILSQEDVHVLEPEVECVGALWSPSTGVLDSHSYYMSLLADAEEHGTTLALHTQVKGAAFHKGRGLQLQFADGTELACDFVVNAAGLWASQIAQYLHSGSSWNPPRQYFAKGTYFQLQGNKGKLPFQHLIYPVPEPGGLGVHATIDWAGQAVKFGPDVEWVEASVPNVENVSLKPDPQRGDKFYAQVRKYWPSLPDGALVADYVGIRPKLNHPDLGTVEFEDFRIVDESVHSVPGLVHLFGIESPGLTSSMAIGDHVASLLLANP